MIKSIFGCLFIIFVSQAVFGGEILLDKYDIFFLRNGTILRNNGVQEPYFKIKEGRLYQASDILIQQINSDGFIANTHDYFQEKTRYFTVYFDRFGNLVKSKADDLYGTITYSPSGQYFVQDTYSKGVFLKKTTYPEYKVYIDDNEINDKIVFSRDERKIIYQKKDGAIYAYDLESNQKNQITKIDDIVYFGDISYDNKTLLLTDGLQILTLNLETGDVKVIIKYAPTIFSYQERFYKNGKVAWTRPDIVQSSFSWREDGKGFIFTRYPEGANFLWLGFGGKLNPPALYYYDLEEGKEYLITEHGTRGKIALRKKQEVKE